MAESQLGPRDKPVRHLGEPISKLRNVVLKAVDDLPESAARAYLLGVLASVTDTYRAICLLTADSATEHFAADCGSLVRSMLETYFSLLFWLQNPTEHSIWYWKSAWLDDKAEMELDELLKQYDPALQERIDARIRERGVLLRLLNLRQAELCGAVPIDPWPSTPGWMINLKAKWKGETTRQQAKRLNDLLYPSLSRRTHPSWLGMGTRYAYREAKKQKNKPKMIARTLQMSRTRAVYEAMLVTTMVLTELDNHLGTGKADALKGIWLSLLEFRPQTRAYYEARFESLLGAL